MGLLMKIQVAHAPRTVFPVSSHPPHPPLLMPKRQLLLTIYKKRRIFPPENLEEGRSMLRTLFHRLRASLRRGKVEREMERELRFHLEMETAENIRRGMSEEEARRAALRSFGGVERTKENLRDARGLGWLEDALQDFRYALRALRRKPGFAAV